MSRSQPAILAEPPAHARYLELRLRAGADPKTALAAIAALTHANNLVAGLGPGLMQAAGGKTVTGMRPFPAMSGPNCEVPSSQADLWLCLSGDDRGIIAGEARALLAKLGSTFELNDLTDGFKYREGRDLSGYVDGTENPTGDEAIEAAIANGDVSPDGSSFVAVQRWVHDLSHFNSLPEGERDHIIGRQLSDNEELDDAPDSAHVKRTAQESFDPEAFVLRRSLPWSDARGEGLMFLAFGCTLDAFEVQMRRMTGAEDGITDALFRFSRPVSGGYYWCPPIENGKLDIGAILS